MNFAPSKELFENGRNQSVLFGFKFFSSLANLSNIGIKYFDMKKFNRILFLLFIFLQYSFLVFGQSDYSDCSRAMVVCNKSPITINELTDYGDQYENALGSCFHKDFVETNSIWLKWKTAEAGSLVFTILPLNVDDDIDFALYRLKNLDYCSFYDPVRCMAAGPNLGLENEFRQGCTGATGLRSGSTEYSKSGGCVKDLENFLNAIEMEADEHYALFINNFRSAGGVFIEWGGTVTFQEIPGQCAGASSLSSTNMIQNGDQIQFAEVFPNPAADLVNINAVSTLDCNGQLQVIGADGQLELSLPIALLSGDNLIELPTENLRAGVHFIRLQTNVESYLLRFIKH